MENLQRFLRAHADQQGKPKLSIHSILALECKAVLHPLPDVDPSLLSVCHDWFDGFKTILSETMRAHCPPLPPYQTAVDSGLDVYTLFDRLKGEEMYPEGIIDEAHLHPLYEQLHLLYDSMLWEHFTFVLEQSFVEEQYFWIGYYVVYRGDRSIQSVLKSFVTPSTEGIADKWFRFMDPDQSDLTMEDLINPRWTKEMLTMKYGSKKKISELPPRLDKLFDEPSEAPKDDVSHTKIHIAVKKVTKDARNRVANCLIYFTMNETLVGAVTINPRLLEQGAKHYMTEYLTDNPEIKHAIKTMLFNQRVMVRYFWMVDHYYLSEVEVPVFLLA